MSSLADVNTPEAVSVVNPQGTEGTGIDRPAASISRKPRGPSKKTREALQLVKEKAFNEGFAHAVMQRRGELPGIFVWMGIACAAGVALGHWLL